MALRNVLKLSHLVGTECRDEGSCRYQENVVSRQTVLRCESAQLFVVIFSLLPAGLHEAQPCRYCFYSVVQK